MKTIAQLLTELRKANPEAQVYFSFANCVPTFVDSWRGIYSEPALGWQASGHSGNVEEYPTVAKLITELEQATDGRKFDGWKGGSYSFNQSQVLHIDNPGDYTCTAIERVEFDDFSLTIHTYKTDAP